MIDPTLLAPVGEPTKPSLFRRIRIAILFAAAVCLFALLEPHVFRLWVRQGLCYEARCHGLALEIGSVQGDFFGPVVFRDVRLTTAGGAVVSKSRVTSARVSFSWKALLLQKGHGFFDRLALDGVYGDFVFKPYARTDTPLCPSPGQDSWLPVPAQTEVSNGFFTFHLGNRTVAFSDVQFTAGASKPGGISIEKLTFEQDRFSRSFTALRGVTALQGSRWRIADLNLSEGVRLNSLSLDLDDAVRGNLRVDFEFAAFGGSLRGELLNTPGTKFPLYEITGHFANIAVEALGKFLLVPEQTGGTIKEGKFSFRGSPHDPENAVVSTRFEAMDFRWGGRQWNSLVLGATVTNRRVQIPELELQQAHNVLRLQGDLTLPGDDTPLWLSDFSFDMTARIHNLTELSALFGPQFADASGQMTVDGSIRSQSKAYTGQILVAGSKLSWRGVPFDLFNAGIKLDGNELQIVNLEAVNGTDFVRGKGAINILGERRYQGEVKASIEELATYAPLLKKPIVPAPLAGRLVVDWSGDGSTGAHSGAFTAHFGKLRTQGTAEVPATLPIDADLEGTYAPGVLALNKCILANDETRIEGRLAANDKTVRLEGIKLTQKKAPWLEGDAVLPFNLFQWWVEPGMAALAPDAPFKARITAKGVQMEDVAHLTGRPLPIRGQLSGTLQTESTLRTLRMNGAIKLTRGQIPATEWMPALDNLEAEAEIDGNILRFTKLGAHHALGDFSATGSLDFSTFDAPAFDLLVHGENVRFNAGPNWEGLGRLDLIIIGRRDAASVNGSGVITALETTPRPDFGALIANGNPETIRVPAPAITLKAPFDRWTYGVNVSTPEPLKIKDGTVSADLQFTGTGASLLATGSVTFAGLPAATALATGKLESGTWYLGGDTPVVARISGKIDLDGSPQKFEGYFFGTQQAPSCVYSGERLEDAERLQSVLTPGAQSRSAANTTLDVGPFVYRPEPAAGGTPADAPTETPPSSPVPQPMP